MCLSQRSGRARLALLVPDVQQPIAKEPAASADGPRLGLAPLVSAATGGGVTGTLRGSRVIHSALSEEDHIEHNRLRCPALHTIFSILLSVKECFSSDISQESCGEQGRSSTLSGTTHELSELRGRLGLMGEMLRISVLSPCHPHRMTFPGKMEQAWLVEVAGYNLFANLQNRLWVCLRVSAAPGWKRRIFLDIARVPRLDVYIDQKLRP